MRYGKRPDRQAAGVKAAAQKKTEQPSRPSAEQPVLCPRPCATRTQAMSEFKNRYMYVCMCVRSQSGLTYRSRDVSTLKWTRLGSKQGLEVAGQRTHRKS